MTSSKQSVKREIRRESQKARCRKFAEQCLSRLSELSPNCSHHIFNEWINNVVADLQSAKSNIPTITSELKNLVTKQPGYQHLSSQKKSKKQPTRRPKIIDTLQQQLRDFAEKILLLRIDKDTTTSELQVVLIASLVVHSGVSSQPMFDAALALLQTPKVLQTTGELAWLELQFLHTERLQNHKSEYQHQLFLHPFSLALWHYWFKSGHYQFAQPMRSTQALESIVQLARNCGIALNCKLRLILRHSIGAIPDTAGLTELLRLANSQIYPNACLTHAQMTGLLKPVSTIAPVKPGEPALSALQLNGAFDVDGQYRVLISALDIPAGMQKRSAQHSIRVLTELTRNSSTIQSYLALWGRTQLESGQLRVSSLLRYYGCFAKSLISNLDSTAWLEYSAEQWSALYEQLIEQCEKSKTQNYRRERLKHFHRFLVEHLSVPSVQWPGSPAFAETVRTGFIGEALFTHLCNSIWQLEPNESLAQQIVLICILAVRLGPRINDILRMQLRDLDNSIHPTLNIHSNAYGTVKSNSGRRRFQPALLLLPHELELFRAHVSRRRAMTNSNSAHLLFSADSSPTEPLNSAQLSSWISSQLRRLAPETEWVFHHFRHTAISRMALINHGQLLKHLPKELRLNLVPYQAEQLNKLENLLCVNAFDLLLYTAGHSHITTTVKHYIHFVPMLIGLALKNHQAEVNPITLQTLTAASGRAMTRLTRQFNTGAINILLNKFWSKPTVTYQHTQQPFLPTPQIEGMEVCHQVLRALENGTTVSDASRFFLLPAEKIIAWEQKAKALARLQSRKGFSRLISLSRKGKFVPTEPHESTEHQCFRQLISRLYKHNLGPTFSVLAERLLHGCNATHSAISLPSGLDWIEFIQQIQLLLEPSQLVITKEDGMPIDVTRGKTTSKHHYLSVQYVRRGSTEKATNTTQMFKLFCFLVVVYCGK
uniref:Uncharacterized protein n=1 Tax=Rheinheimera sp. BAL341 TaxID=1708203 RepID=A0A486XNY6_9GAMM